MIRIDTLFKVMEIMKSTYNDFYGLDASFNKDGSGSASAYVNGNKKKFEVLSNPTRLIEV